MKALLLHFAVLAALLVAGLTLPDYPQTTLTRVLLLAAFATGYGIAFGYAGMLSLGHALFFAAGVYGAGLPIRHWEWAPEPAFLAGLASGAGLALAVGLLALRTVGPAFMIVTLMLAQAGHLTLLHFSTLTGGDEGYVLPAAARTVFGLDLTAPVPRFLAALGLYAACLLAALRLAASRAGRVLRAIRENEERVRLLGYDPLRRKLGALVLSGAMAGAAGAAYALAFGYVGATFATIQYSILPLLYVLLGGAGTTLGPLVGALLMTVLIDRASEVTPAYMLVAGVALILLVLFAPSGLLGRLRARHPRWLP